MKVRIGIAGFFLALNAAADCPVSHPRVQPAIPNVAVASEADMHRAQLEAEQYLLTGSQYLECGFMNRRQYIQLSQQLEIFSALYSDALEEYQSRRLIIQETGLATAGRDSGTSGN